jgi:hypothetical protein
VLLRTIVRSAACVTCAAILTFSTAPAVALTPSSLLAGSTLSMTASGGYQKPVALSHPDVAPSVPGASIPRPAPSGTAPAAPLVPVRDASGSGSTHLDAGSHLTPLMGSGGSGKNSISFAQFDDGDIVVVTDPTSITGHAGIFDSRYYSNIYSHAVLSANITPVDGVQREQCLKYRTYDRAYALWVPSEYNHRVSARNFAYGKLGKPYNLLAAKTDMRSFYCSKLVWAAWRYTSGLNLDADGGHWVWPIDLVNSRYTAAFGCWS